MPLVFAATNLVLFGFRIRRVMITRQLFLFPLTRTKDNSREMFKNMTVHIFYMLSSLDITISLSIVIFAF